jgi:hypothetical protein
MEWMTLCYTNKKSPSAEGATLLTLIYYYEKTKSISHERFIILSCLRALLLGFPAF